MRKTCKKQLPLPEATTVHPKAQELEKISNILDENSNIYELAAQGPGTVKNNTGANGMSTKQVIRAAIADERIQLRGACLPPGRLQNIPQFWRKVWAGYMIIVTGGAGFIGSNIVRTLNEQGVSDILVVDNLKNGVKFRNIVDCEIAA